MDDKRIKFLDTLFGKDHKSRNRRNFFINLRQAKEIYPKIPKNDKEALAYLKEKGLVREIINGEHIERV